LCYKTPLKGDIALLLPGYTDQSLKKEMVEMKCKKCDGLMVLQSFFDHFLNFEGWKCLNCGKIIVRKDKTIEYDSFSIFYQQNKCKNRN